MLLSLFVFVRNIISISLLFYYLWIICWLQNATMCWDLWISSQAELHLHNPQYLLERWLLERYARGIVTQVKWDWCHCTPDCWVLCGWKKRYTRMDQNCVGLLTLTAPTCLIKFKCFLYLEKHSELFISLICSYFKLAHLISIIERVLQSGSLWIFELPAPSQDTESIYRCLLTWYWYFGKCN